MKSLPNNHSFELNNESRYWKTGGEAVLHQGFKTYHFLLSTVPTALQDFKSGPDDTAENLAERLENFLQKRLGKG